jgi:hypothetical protein
MQFQVPQFIDVEDKIFGPLTFRQFVYIAGGAGFSYILWRLLPSFAALPLITAVGGTAAAFAFLQWNGQPFLMAVEHAFYFLIHNKLYLWNNARARAVRADLDAKKEAAAKQAIREEVVYTPKLSDSKLHELAWSLDINERIANGVLTDEERARHREDAYTAIRTARKALVG